MILKKFNYNGGQSCNALIKCDMCGNEKVKRIILIGYNKNHFCCKECYVNFVLSKKNLKLKTLLNQASNKLKSVNIINKCNKSVKDC